MAFGTWHWPYETLRVKLTNAVGRGLTTFPLARNALRAAYPSASGPRGGTMPRVAGMRGRPACRPDWMCG
jgi:hypothetical protein